jgi:hypothetical protein
MQQHTAGGFHGLAIFSPLIISTSWLWPKSYDTVVLCFPNPIKATRLVIVADMLLYIVHRICYSCPTLKLWSGQHKHHRVASPTASSIEPNPETARCICHLYGTGPALLRNSYTGATLNAAQSKEVDVAMLPAVLAKNASTRGAQVNIQGDKTLKPILPSMREAMLEQAKRTTPRSLWDTRKRRPPLVHLRPPRG